MANSRSLRDGIRCPTSRGTQDCFEKLNDSCLEFESREKTLRWEVIVLTETTGVSLLIASSYPHSLVVTLEWNEHYCVHPFAPAVAELEPAPLRKELASNTNAHTLCICRASELLCGMWTTARVYS